MASRNFIINAVAIYGQPIYIPDYPCQSTPAGLPLPDYACRTTLAGLPLPVWLGLYLSLSTWLGALSIPAGLVGGNIYPCRSGWGLNLLGFQDDEGAITQSGSNKRSVSVEAAGTNMLLQSQLAHQTAVSNIPEPENGAVVSHRTAIIRSKRWVRELKEL